MSLDQDSVIVAFSRLVEHIAKYPDEGHKVANEWQDFIKSYTTIMTKNDSSLASACSAIEMAGIRALTTARDARSIDGRVEAFSKAVSDISERLGKTKAGDAFVGAISEKVGGEKVPAYIATKHYKEKVKEWQKNGGKKSGVTAPILGDSVRELQQIKIDNDKTNGISVEAPASITQKEEKETPKRNVTLYRDRAGKFTSKANAERIFQEDLQGPPSPSQEILEQRQRDEDGPGPVAPQDVLDSRDKADRDAIWQARKDKFKSGMKAVGNGIATAGRVTGNVVGAAGRLSALAGGALAATGDPFLMRTGGALAAPFALAKGMSKAGSFLTNGWNAGKDKSGSGGSSSDSKEEDKKETSDFQDKVIELLKIIAGKKDGAGNAATEEKPKSLLDRLKEGIKSPLGAAKNLFSKIPKGLLAKTAGRAALFGGGALAHNASGSNFLTPDSGEDTKANDVNAELEAGGNAAMVAAIPMPLPIKAAALGVVGIAYAGRKLQQHQQSKSDENDKNLAAKVEGGIDTEKLKTFSDAGAMSQFTDMLGGKSSEKGQYKVLIEEMISNNKTFSKEQVELIKKKFAIDVPSSLISESATSETSTNTSSNATVETNTSSNTSASVETNNSSSNANSTVETISKNSAAATKVSESSTVSSEKVIERAADSLEKVGASIASNASSKSSGTTVNNSNKTIFAGREYARNGDSTFSRILFNNHVVV